MEHQRGRQEVLDLLQAQLDSTRDMAVALLDLDDFHQKVAGPREDAAKEAFLLEVLEALAGAVALADSRVVRSGRDELLVTYPDSDLSNLVATLYTRLPRFKHQAFVLPHSNGEEVSFTCTAAAAAPPSHGKTAIHLLRTLEDTLFRGKVGGKDRVAIPEDSPMVLKASYYSREQLERLRARAQGLGRTEADLLREALDDLLRKYGD